MPNRPLMRILTAPRLFFTAVVACGCVAVASAFAQPATLRSENRQVAGTVAAAYLGRDRVSLDASSTSVALDGTFGFNARLVLASDADSTQVRFRLRNPAGRLLFQRTRVADDPKRGIVLEHFERDTADLDLEPGIYPAELTVTIRREGRELEKTLNARLMLYDPAKPPLDVAVVARVSGQPLSDPNGRLIADPGTYTRARDDVAALAAWVTSRPDARVTLAVSPLLLEEWKRIAEGYELAGPEGISRVDAESAVPKEYGAALASLGRAIETGRLELTGLGFSDPDLSDLAGAGLLADVAVQYGQGLSSTYASLETTPSTGTVPAGGCMPPAAVKPLVDAGIAYAVVDAACTRSGDATATPSSYRTAGGLVILVPDSRLSAAIAARDESRTAADAFGRIVEGTQGPLVLALELGPGGTAADALTEAANLLEAQPWARTRLAREVAAPPRRRTALRARDTTRGDPGDYWAETRESRLWASALSAAVGESEPPALRAQRDSLIAQCSAWAGTDDSWAFADRGRVFSSTAKRLAADILGGVALSTEPVTLAGTTGKVPVTVRNTGDRELAVIVRASSGGGLRLTEEARKKVALGPGETLIEIPVDLRAAVNGDLRLTVIAGDVELDSATVRVTASYLDRIAAVGAVVLLLGILLAFIIRRVSKAERIAETDAGREAYTGSNVHRGGSTRR